MTFRELLQQYNLTQDQLARKLKLSQCAVSKWVRGACAPNGDNMKKIAKVLKVNAMIVAQCFYN